MKLIEITEDGTPAEAINDLPSVAHEVMKATAAMYLSGGYVPPWVGYLALEDARSVGTCGFKSPPQNNRVEIAYFTFPGNEGRGVARCMARALVNLALKAAPGIIIAAQTLPEENASTAVLKKVGFQFVAEVEHPEDGKVWEWRLSKANMETGPVITAV